MKIIKKWLKENDIEFTEMNDISADRIKIVIERDYETTNSKGDKVVMDKFLLVSFGTTHKKYAVNYEYEVSLVKTLARGIGKQKEIVEELVKFFNK